MNGLTAVVLGGTGLVGSHLVQFLMDEPRIEKIRLLTRRSVEIQHPKVEVLVTDFANFDAYRENLGKGDIIFCSIGTTLAQVKGNRQRYREIDFDIAVNAARFGKEAGFHTYILVSSHLANSKSPFFYTKLKGEIEEVVGQFRWEKLCIFRPSFLLGKRKHSRPLEFIFQQLARWIKPLLPAKYRPVKAEDVAKAMLEAALYDEPGLHFYHYHDMLQAASARRKPWQRKIDE